MAVTFEFVGPLLVGLLGSRRALLGSSVAEAPTEAWAPALTYAARRRRRSRLSLRRGIRVTVAISTVGAALDASTSSNDGMWRSI